MKPALAPAIAAALALLAASPSARAQVDASSQPAQQAPAPIVRPRPRPAPYQNSFPVSSATGATGATVRHGQPATGSTGSTGTGSAASVRHTPATAASGPTAVQHASAAGATGSTAPAAPAEPQAGVLNRTSIVLDPAHGAQDSGSRLADNLVEKDVTLALAFKLRSLLQARGFTVVLTRDSDAATLNGQPLTLDDRAGLANHERAAACLLLHATAVGTGVHLYRSELTPAAGESTLLNWLTAQAPWVNQSAALADRLSQALTHANIANVNATASVRPVDSLTCPALVLELAPKSSGDTSSLTSDGYQNDVAQAVANALVFWKSAVQPPPRITPPAPATATHTDASGLAVPLVRPHPKPLPPQEPALPETDQ